LEGVLGKARAEALVARMALMIGVEKCMILNEVGSEAIGLGLSVLDEYFVSRSSVRALDYILAAVNLF
jgi:hypothetical protein